MKLSFSVVQTFDACPRQFQHLYVLKDVERVGNATTQRGSDTHAQIEAYLRSGEALPDELRAAVDGVVAPLRAARFALFPEQEWQIDGFIGRIDLLAVKGDAAVVVDWKTGKPRQTKQLDYYAWAVYRTRPEVQRVSAFNVYLDTGKPGPVEKTTRQNLDRLNWAAGHDKWRIERCEKSGDWPAVQGWKCAYCPVKQCEFNRSA